MFQCPECQPLLLDYHYGLLESAEAAAVEAHLAQCPTCRAEGDRAAHERELLARAAKAPFPSISFSAPVSVAEPSRKEKSMASSKASRHPGSSDMSMRSRIVWWTVAAVVILAIAAVGGPASLDTAGIAYNKPVVLQSMNDVKAKAAERDRLKAEVTKKKAEVDERLAAAKKTQEEIENQWIKAESEAVAKAAARPFHVDVRGPGTAVPGAPNQYTIHVTDSNGRPHAAEVEAIVKDTDGKELFSTKFQPDKHPDGNRFQLPAGIWAKVASGSEVSLTVFAVDAKTGARSELTESIKLFEPVYTTFLTTDKPMYRPGETVYYRSLTLDRTRFLPPNNDVTLRYEIKAPSGEVVAGSQQMGLAKATRPDQFGRQQPVIGPDGQPVRGIGTGLFKLGENLAGGEYVLNVYEVPSANDKPAKSKPLAVRKFIVNNYKPDQLSKKLEFDGKSYGPGDVVQAKFEVKDQATPLVAQLTIVVNVDGKDIKVDAAPTKTEADGSASIRFTLPKVEEIKDARIDIATTAKGTTETLTRKIPLTTKRLNLEFFPEGGDLIQGVVNRVYFRATNTFGKPADVIGTLTDGTKDLAPLRTLTDAEKPGVNQGLGMFEFTPEAGKQYFVRLEKPIGIIQPVVEMKLSPPGALFGGTSVLSRGYALPAAKVQGIALAVPNGVLEAAKPITVKLSTADAKRNILVGAYTRGRPVAHATATVEPGKVTELTLNPTDGKLGGVTRITVFDAGNVEEVGRTNLKPVAERLIYRQPGEVLKLAYATKKASGDVSKSFTPGSKVTLEVNSTDESGKPVPAILWATVVNESVLTMADEKTARLLPTHFLLNGEVQKGDDLEHADFLLTDHAKAATSLDLLLGTQGWRRFAEQSPAEFRNKVPAEDADRLMVAAAIEGPIPTGWRSNIRKVFEQFWPKYEAAQIESEAAQQAQIRFMASGELEKTTAAAASAHAAALREYGEKASELEGFDKRAESRKELLPVFLIFLLGGSVLTFLFRTFAFQPGSPERLPLTLGSIALVLLAGFLGFSVAINSQGNEEWRALAQSAPKPDKYFQYTTRATGVAPRPADMAPAMGNIEIGQEAFPKNGLDDAAKGMPIEGGIGGAGPEGFAKPAGPGGPPGAFPPQAAAEPGAPGVPFHKAMAPGVPLQDRRRDVAPLPVAGGLAEGGRGGKRDQQWNVPLRPVMPGTPAVPGAGMPGPFGGKPGFDEVMSLRAKQQQLQYGTPREQALANFLARRQIDLAKASIRDGKGQIPEQLLEVALVDNLPPSVSALIVREYAHVSKNLTDSPENVREDFTETLLWQPVLVTPKDGRATIQFDLSDAVNPYQVMVAGHTLDGRLGAITGTIEVRKPLSITPKFPLEIGSSDKLDVAITTLNATDKEFEAELGIESKGLKADNLAEALKLTVPGNNGGRKLVRLTPDVSDGNVNVKLTGMVKKGESVLYQDSELRSTKVIRDGFPANGQKSDVLETQLNTKLKLPEQIVPGSLALKVNVFPNMLSEVQAGLEGLLREPSGCFEQTSTSNYPNVMILNYLNEAGKAAPDVSTRAKQLLERGYAKLVSFECQDPGKQEVRKGYEWFGGTAPPHEALTAYGLLQFIDMAKVSPVDEKMIQRTKEYLLSRRDGKGGFERNSRALDSFGYAPADVTNAYIVWALTEAERTNPEKSDLSKEIAALLQRTKEGKHSKDPYFLALVANSLINRGEHKEGDALLKILAGMQDKEGTVNGAETSITRSTGKDLLVETTALAVLGWLKRNETGTYRVNVDMAARWMGGQRGGYGAFGGTQSTILALKALVDYARSQKRTKESGTIKVLVAGVEVGKKSFTSDQVGPIVIDIPNVDDILKNGEADIRIETDAKESYPCTVAWECRTRKPNSSPDCPVALTTSLSKATAREGEVVNMKVQVKNLKETEHGMVVAIVGIPAGLKLPEDMKQLKAMTEKPEGGREKVSYWEIRGRELILYWRGMGPKDVADLGIDLIAEYNGKYIGPASRAYLYYGSEHKHWVDPVEITVSPK